MLRRQARVFSNQNLIADFFRSNVEIGDIYQTDDNGWIVITNIFALQPQLDIKNYLLRPSNAKDINLSRETGTNISFDANVNTGSLLASGAQINFDQKNSAFVSLKKGVWQNLDLVKMKPVLDELWQSNGYNKKAGRYFFVNQICTADSGVTIFSEQKNNSVSIQSTTDKKLSSLITIGEGQIEIVSSKNEILEIISNVPHSPIFQAVRMKNNGLWEIMG